MIYVRFRTVALVPPKSQFCVKHSLFESARSSHNRNEMGGTYDIVTHDGPELALAIATDTFRPLACTAPISVTGSSSTTARIHGADVRCVASIHVSAAGDAETGVMMRELTPSELTGEAMFMCHKLTRVRTPSAIFVAMMQTRADRTIDVAVATRREYVPRDDADCAAIVSAFVEMTKNARSWPGMSVRVVGAAITQPERKVCDKLCEHYSATATHFLERDDVPAIRNRIFVAF
jgi:hypothetical protein